MRAKERIAYLRGLLDAGQPEDETQLPIYNAIIDALSVLADEVEEQAMQIKDQRDLYTELVDYCEELDEDLDILENDVEDIKALGEHMEKDAEPEYDEMYQSAVCPFCNNMFYYQPDAYEEDEPLECPNCGKTFDRSEKQVEEGE